VDVQAQPHGALRVLAPVMRRRMPRISRRIVNRLRVLLEEDRAAVRAEAG
jgi:hypothetical protein